MDRPLHTRRTRNHDNAARVREIIAQELGVEQEKVVDDANFVDDLGADSLDTVELVMAFEEEFGIEIPDEDAERMQTVQEAIAYLNEKPSACLPLIS